MKNFINKTKRPLISGICLMAALFILANTGYAQDSTVQLPIMTGRCCRTGSTR